MNVRGIISAIKEEYKAKKRGAEELKGGASMQAIKKKYRQDSATYRGAKEQEIKQQAQEAYYKEKARLKTKQAKERAGGLRKTFRGLKRRGIGGVGIASGSGGLDMSVKPVFGGGLSQNVKPVKRNKFVFKL
jgi:hypothetical protein